MNRGSALVTALLVIVILLVLAVAYISRVAVEYTLTAKSDRAVGAVYLAEAGIDQAIWELNYRKTWSGWGYGGSPDGGTVRSMTVSSFLDVNGKGVGAYTVTVDIPASENPVRVVASGYVPAQNTKATKRSVRVTLNNSLFSKAVVGEDGVTLNGLALTDSYDSRLGPYLNQPHGNEGDVASNGDITLIGQSVISGDATPGAGDTVNIGSQSSVTGSTAPAQADFELDPIPPEDLAAAQTTNNNFTIPPEVLPAGSYNLSLSGSTQLVLYSGTYYFTSISTGGQSSIVISGNVVIYIEGGDVNIGGQGILNNAAPTGLQIYSTGPVVNLGGQAAFAGVVYAPNAAIDASGQSGIYGSVVGKTVTASGQGGIHYDIALKDLASSFGKYRLVTWEEL